MFVPYRIDITSLLEEENILEIEFRSAYNVSEKIRRQRGDLVCYNGHYGRPYVRKAQYNFGWDWGPSLITCGPWKPVFIERYSNRIEDVRIEVDLTEDLSHAQVEVHVTPTNAGADTFAHVQVTDANGRMVEAATVTAFAWTFEVQQPQLWYSRDLGAQPMYTATIQLSRNDGVVLDTTKKSFGVRRIDLVKDADSNGSTFYFKVNNLPIFAGGNNWIPGDSFLPRMTPDRYRRWVEFATKGNHNIMRVWGGGIYEDDSFYDECDRQGILVWQDFCFACAQYPADEVFRDSVKSEAIAAVRRLRNHPCLALLAGNNEDYPLANDACKPVMPHYFLTSNSVNA